MTDQDVDRDEDWVPLVRAAHEAGVPITTIRDWYRTGAIESMATPEGQRLVRLSQALEQATGRGSSRGRSATQRPSQTPEEIQAEVEAIATRTRAVAELQEAARERMEDPSK